MISQFRYSNMKMIKYECGSHAAYLQNVSDCWIKNNCASVIQDTPIS